MIWYLLYPLRGTSEPPALSPKNPFRRAFTRYAKSASRHIVATLLASVAVATLLVYPFPFLYTTGFTNGASTLPHHVWTDAHPLDPGVTVDPDIIVRSIWIHGDYLRALDKDVLSGALNLQDRMIDVAALNESVGAARPGVREGDPASDSRHVGSNVADGPATRSWIFHSPLFYWAGSEDLIMADPDVVKTINKCKTLHSGVNTTLRHPIIFSGQRYQDRRLVAADALVLTLIHLRGSSIGQEWERRATALAADAADQWDVTLPEGPNMQGHLYEFRFLPMSVRDLVMLTTAYIFIIIYTFWTLSKLRAIKSKAGLIVTIVVQLLFSVVSSFTICAVFQIDLSRIPRAAYPFVMLAMGLEHVFRLINAVIATSPEDSTSNRIGHAYGETAMVAAVSSLQNSALLFAISRLVSPPVAAFCIFTAIAIPFDFFYLSTFFLAVLSVDVRRNELSDSLDKDSRTKGRPAQKEQGATERFLYGRVAFSTRVAGIIVVLGFVLIAQWHFLDFGVMSQTQGLVSRLFESPSQLPPSSTTVNPTLSGRRAQGPTSWLNIQDQETAHEMIRTLKPNVHNYVALVYDPVVFVLKGANRASPDPPPTFELPPTVQDFLHYQTGSLVVTMILILIAMWALVNRLLADEFLSTPEDDEPQDEKLLSITTLKEGHLLDVAHLEASPDGKLITVGLDRIVRVWDLRRSHEGSYAVHDLEDGRDPPFPVLGVAVDRESNWAAFASPSGVDLWNLRERRWGCSMKVDWQGSKPSLVAFVADPTSPLKPVLVLRRDGVLADIRMDEGKTYETPICRAPIVSAEVLPTSVSNGTRIPQRLLTASRKGCIHLATQSTPMWMCGNFMLPSESGDVDSVVTLPSIHAFLVAHKTSVELYDIDSNQLIHRFGVQLMQRRSLKCTYNLRKNLPSGLGGLSSLSLAYINAVTKELVLQTYVPAQEDGAVYELGSGRGSEVGVLGCRWGTTRVVERTVHSPGRWTTLPSGSILGVRKKDYETCCGSTTTETIMDTSPPHSGLRRRRVGRLAVGAGKLLSDHNNHQHHNTRSSQAPQPRVDGGDDWEVWMMSHLDSETALEETTPLCPEKDGHLLVSGLGPMINVGTSSVAVALGDVVKVISVGKARFGDEDEDGLRGGEGRRRRGRRAASERSGSTRGTFSVGQWKDW